MKARDRLDKIMASCTERMQEEVSALLGKTVTLGKPETNILTKEQVFDRVDGKSVLAHTQLEGELDGAGGLIVPLKDAIRIGGTLIMLPDSELQTVISEENYSEEIEDSYGEIANIICGSMTSVFEEQHPEKFRVVRTEQEIVIPTKVEIASEQPFPDTSYFVCSLSMAMDATEMGTLNILFPALPLGLVEDGTADSASPTADAESETGTAQPVQAETPEQKQDQAPPPSAVDKKAVSRQQKQIDGLLKTCFATVGEEVSALIGGTLAITELQYKLCTKEELLEELEGKQVVANLEVRGAESSDSYLFARLSAAIRLGGSLIMLPEAELAEAVRNEDFVEDAQDAYEEITNIIAGVYTAVFEEQYKEKLGFVKTATETITPIKIDSQSDETLPRQLYYLASGDLDFNGNGLGRLQAAFPAALFELEGLADTGAADQDHEQQETDNQQVQQTSGESAETAQSGERVPVADQGAAATAEQGVATPADQGAAASVEQSAAEDSQVADILLFSDDEQQGASIHELLRQLGYSPRLLPFKSNINNAVTSSVQLVFIVMREVSEQGFGVAIKISSSGYAIPIVACGPAWTRSLVIKAVKYGADDILVTPSTVDEVREKVEMNLSRIAA